MNWTRGLFRIWLLFAVGCTAIAYFATHYSPRLNCAWDCTDAVYQQLFALWGLPWIVLALGILMRWALLGFRR